MATILRENRELQIVCLDKKVTRAPKKSYIKLGHLSTENRPSYRVNTHLQEHLSYCILFWLRWPHFRSRDTLGDKLLQHVVATCRSDKSLRVHWRIFAKVFVSAMSRTKSNQTEFKQLSAVTKFCFGDKDFHKNSPVHTRRLSLQRVQQLVAGTYRPTCTHGVICHYEVLQRHVA